MSTFADVVLNTKVETKDAVLVKQTQLTRLEMGPTKGSGKAWLVEVHVRVPALANHSFTSGAITLNGSTVEFSSKIIVFVGFWRYPPTGSTKAAGNVLNLEFVNKNQDGVWHKERIHYTAVKVKAKNLSSADEDLQALQELTVSPKVLFPNIDYRAELQ